SEMWSETESWLRKVGALAAFPPPFAAPTGFFRLFGQARKMRPGELPRRAALGQRARAWPRLRPLPARDGAASRAGPIGRPWPGLLPLRRPDRARRPRGPLPAV